MWSLVVLAPALPGRSRPASASPVLARKHSSGWNPNPLLEVGAACAFSEWQAISVASRPRTSLGRVRPAALAAGMPSPCSAGFAGLGASRSQRDRDGPAAVGEHHRQIGGDPARIMSDPARPKRSPSGGIGGGQPGGISEVRKMSCSGMPDHPRTIGTNLGPRDATR